LTLVAYVSNGPIFTITSRATEAAVVVEVDIARSTLTIGQIFTILLPDRGKTERVGLIMFFIALVESGYEIRLLTGTADFGRIVLFFN